MTGYQQNKPKKNFRRRAALEPVISHLKTDHRLGRTFYQGIFGANINVMLAAAAFNFKGMMNKWKAFFFIFLTKPHLGYPSDSIATYYQLQKKMSF
ncbi:MAG: transposase [Flavisolibacter sp.]|nr:transposase [Flavisolibacter sp.]